MKRSENQPLPLNGGRRIRKMAVILRPCHFELFSANQQKTSSQYATLGMLTVELLN
jgi:hypothetical protein